MEQTISSIDIPKNENDDNSIDSEVAKLHLKNVLSYCKSLLENDLITPTSSSTISEDSMIIGQELYQYIIKILNEKKLMSKEELISVDETDEENQFHEVDSQLTVNIEYVPIKKPKIYDFISFETKIKVVNLAKNIPLGICVLSREKLPVTY